MNNKKSCVTVKKTDVVVKRCWTFCLLAMVGYILVACGSDTGGSSSSDFTITAKGNPILGYNYTFPNEWQEQSNTYVIPQSPTMTTDEDITEDFPAPFGVALDGVDLDPLTAECYDASGIRESGNSCAYRQDALQLINDLGFDDKVGHIQPKPNSGNYHYHAMSQATAEAIYERFTGSMPAGKDLILVGFARDGYPVLYSLQNSYSSGWNLKSSVTRTDFMPGSVAGDNIGIYVEDYKYTGTPVLSGTTVLDNCNGITTTNEILATIDEYSDLTSAGVDLSSYDFAYIINDRLQKAQPKYTFQQFHIV